MRCLSSDSKGISFLRKDQTWESTEALVGPTCVLVLDHSNVSLLFLLFIYFAQIREWGEHKESLQAPFHNFLI